MILLLEKKKDGENSNSSQSNPDDVSSYRKLLSFFFFLLVVVSLSKYDSLLLKKLPQKIFNLKKYTSNLCRIMQNYAFSPHSFTISLSSLLLLCWLCFNNTVFFFLSFSTQEEWDGNGKISKIFILSTAKEKWFSHQNLF